MDLNEVKSQEGPMRRFKITVPNGADGLPGMPSIELRQSLPAAIEKAKRLAAKCYRIARVQEIKTHKTWIVDASGVRREVADFNIN